MGAKRPDHIVDGETSRFGVCEHTRGERTQPTIVLAARVGLRRRGADERTDPALCFDDAGTLELRVHTRNGIRIDLEVDRKLAHRWQLITRTQAAGRDRRAQPTFELGVDRRWIALVDGDDVRHYSLESYYTNITVQLLRVKGRPAPQFQRRDPVADVAETKALGS